MREKIKNILVINPFGIGDVLFSTVLVESLGRQTQGCRIGFLCNRRTEGLLRKNPLVSQVFVFEKDEYRQLWKSSKITCLKKFISLLGDIKAAKFDIVIDLSLSRQFGFITWLIGIPRRIGFNYKNRGMFFTDKVNVTGYNDKHIVEYYISLLNSIDVKPVVGGLKIYTGDDEKKWAMDFLKANGVEQDDLVVGIVPGAGASWGKDASIKHWKKEGFAQAADRLINEFRAKVIVFGSEGERDVCESVKSNMKNPAIDACGKTTLLQFAALAGMCRLVIANDGGPLHVAVAMGVKTIGIFGPVDEKVYGQYPSGQNHKAVTADIECRPCYRNFKMKDCKVRRCLEEITADEVFKAAVKML